MAAASPTGIRLAGVALAAGALMFVATLLRIVEHLGAAGTTGTRLFSRLAT